MSKVVNYPKTIYDPSVISDAQISTWSREAMQNGMFNQVNGTVSGYASNGLKFVGYLDDKGVIKNFYPVFD